MFHNAAETYLCCCCCYRNNLTIVSEYDFQMLVSFRHTANKGPKEENAIQLSQRLVMFLKTLKKTLLHQRTHPKFRQNDHFSGKFHRNLSSQTKSVKTEAGLSCDLRSHVATPAVHCSLSSKRHHIRFKPAALWLPVSSPAGTGGLLHSDWCSASREPFLDRQ